MIHELADYEKEPDQVVATEETLRRTLTFAPSAVGHTNPGYAKTLLLRLPIEPSPQHPNDKPEAVVGMAMYFTSYSTWRAQPGVYLEDLFVKPDYRKRGFGKMLIRELAREVLRINGGRLEWTCLKWNEPSLQFYRSLGAVEMDEWVRLRVDGEALKRLAVEQAREVQGGHVNATGR